MKPRVLVCAGLDPSGRAGLLADLEAIREAGGEAFGVATALTAQGRGTFQVQPASPAVLAAQIRALGGAFQAVKLGMVPSRAHLSAIRRTLEGFRGFWVVDPVTRTSRGERLSSLLPSDYLRLAGARVVLTPNLPELGWLGAPDAAALVRRGFGGAVVKGGHGAGVRLVDSVASRAGVAWLGARKLPRSATKRGTGCRFASALAVGLARGEPLERAAKGAQRLVAAYLRRA